MSPIEIARAILLAALPDGVPPSFSRIDRASFVGKREIIAHLTMFDGLKAVAHFRKWALGWSTGWDDMPGGDISFEDGAWTRVVRP